MIYIFKIVVNFYLNYFYSTWRSIHKNLYELKNPSKIFLNSHHQGSVNIMKYYILHNKLYAI